MILELWNSMNIPVTTHFEIYNIYGKNILYKKKKVNLIFLCNFCLNSFLHQQYVVSYSRDPNSNTRVLT
jgi:hypothetical protein